MAVRACTPTCAQDVRCSRKRVVHLMRQANLVTRTCRTPRTTDSRHSLAVAPNVLDRQFAVDRSTEVWVSDSTYLPTREGWLYLAVVLDLYARRVVGWSMQPTLERKLVLTALGDAIGRRQPGAGLLHHSDRGSQYASGEYQALLASAQITPSMSRKGNCWDNAAMERFFATLKAELPQTVFASHAAARSAGSTTSSASTIASNTIRRWTIRRRSHMSRSMLPAMPIDPVSVKSGQYQLEVLACGLAVWLTVVGLHIRALQHTQPQYYASFLLRIVLIKIVSLSLLVTSECMLSVDADGIYWIVPAFVFSFIVARSNAWVLLIEIDRYHSSW